MQALAQQIAYDLIQADKPLIISGTSLSSTALIEAAAQITQALTQKRAAIKATEQQQVEAHNEQVRAAEAQTATAQQSEDKDLSAKPNKPETGVDTEAQDDVEREPATKLELKEVNDSYHAQAGIYLTVPDANSMGVCMLGGQSVEELLATDFDVVIVAENQLTDAIDANKLIPVFMSVFDVDIVMGGWVLNAYVLAMSVGLMLSGYLNKKFPFKYVYLAAIFGFMLGSVIGMLASSMGFVIIARAIQGLSGGLIIPLSIGILYQIYPQKQHGRVMALWGIVIMMSLAFGPLVGAYLVEQFAWWTLFAITLPLSMAVMAMVWWLIPDMRSHDKKSPFDTIGFVSLLIDRSIVAFFIALTDTCITECDVIAGDIARHHPYKCRVKYRRYMQFLGKIGIHLSISGFDSFL